MLPVEPEDISELDQGAVHVAGLQQLQPGLIMGLGPFLGGVAKGQKSRGGKRQKVGFITSFALHVQTRPKGARRSWDRVALSTTYGCRPG